MQLFKNFPLEHAPGPPESFCYLNCIQSTVPEKAALEKVTKSGALSLQKNSQCAPDMKHFHRAYLLPFPLLNVSASLYLVNIQPNSKLHPPHQNFLDPLLNGTDNDTKKVSRYCPSLQIYFAF